MKNFDLKNLIIKKLFYISQDITILMFIIYL